MKESIERTPEDRKQTRDFLAKAGERTQANAYGFASDMQDCSLHWSEDMRELTIRHPHKIGLPIGDKIRALTLKREQSPEAIAAAPELLEACKRLVAWVDAGCDPSRQSLNAARAAIAKAEGK